MICQHKLNFDFEVFLVLALYFLLDGVYCD